MSRITHTRKSGPGRRHLDGTGSRTKKLGFAATLMAAWAELRRQKLEEARYAARRG